MNIYKRYSIALKDNENEKFNKVKNHYENIGIKKIFLEGLNLLNDKIPASPVVKIEIE